MTDTALQPAPLDATDPTGPTGPTGSAHAQHPCLKAVMRRLAMSLWVACVAPATLFYVALVSVGITTAVIAALVWSYSAIAWRWARKRPMSGLLLLTVTVLTVRTAFTLSTGDTFFYFLQPVVSDGVVAAVFLLSLATTRPVVSRLAADFYPLTTHTAGHPRVRQLFWRLTLMWAAVCLAKGAVGFWLLETLSTADFVLFKSIAMVAMTGLAVAVTVWASVRVLRHDSMLAQPSTP